MIEFRPALLTSLKHYSGRNSPPTSWPASSSASWPCRWRSPSASHRAFHRKRHHHGHHRRLPHIGARRQSRTDRRPHRCIHRDRLWHHPTVRHRGTDRRHDHGGRIPDPAGTLPPGDDHQIHSLPDRRRFHQRYRRDDLHHADQGSVRPRPRNAGRLRREVDSLLPEFRDDRPLGNGRRRYQRRHHRPHARFSKRYPVR